MGKFKVGDRVLCTETCEGQFTAGKTYTVRALNTHSLGVVEDDSGCENGWSYDFFKTVPIAEATGTAADGTQADKPKFKVGDAIRHKELNYVGTVKEVYADGTVETFWPAEGWGGRDPVEDIEPTTLTIQPGHYYITRDGRKVGPARQNWGDSDYPWWVGESTYTDSGAWLTGGYVDDANLVAEACEEPQTNKEILDELEAWIAEQDAIKAAGKGSARGSTAGFTVPVCAYGGELENEVDATLTTKITVDFSDFDAELDRIFGRLRKLKRKARKMGISLDAGGLQDAA